MWIVVNVGCLECGVEHEFYGVFNVAGDAEKLAKRLNGKNGSDQSAIVIPWDGKMRDLSNAIQPLWSDN